MVQLGRDRLSSVGLGDGPVECTTASNQREQKLHDDLVTAVRRPSRVVQRLHDFIVDRAGEWTAADGIRASS